MELKLSFQLYFDLANLSDAFPIHICTASAANSNLVSERGFKSNWNILAHDWQC